MKPKVHLWKMQYNCETSRQYDVDKKRECKSYQYQEGKKGYHYRPPEIKKIIRIYYKYFYAHNSTT